MEKKLNLVGTIENDFYVYLVNKEPKIKFQIDKHTIHIENFECYDNMSDETLAFFGHLYLDDKRVGTCSNQGRGGTADVHINNNYYDLEIEIINLLSDKKDYCFINQKLTLDDIADKLACFIATFNDNKVKTKSKALAVIKAIQQNSDEYREYFLKKDKEKINKEATTEIVKENNNNVVNKYGTEWNVVTDINTFGSFSDCKLILSVSEGNLYINNNNGKVFFADANGKTYTKNIK